jgi:hypothetical protein
METFTRLMWAREGAFRSDLSLPFTSPKTKRLHLGKLKITDVRTANASEAKLTSIKRGSRVDVGDTVIYVKPDNQRKAP